MSTIRTFQFHETGVIPGIAGEFHAGLLVDVDLDTMTVVNQRLANAPAIEMQEPQEEPVPESTEQPSEQPASEADNIEQGGSE